MLPLLKVQTTVLKQLTFQNTQITHSLENKLIKCLLHDALVGILYSFYEDHAQAFWIGYKL